MKLVKFKSIREEIEVDFERHVFVPSWVFPGKQCDKCKFEIEECGLVVATSKGDVYVFHESCWHNG